MGSNPTPGAKKLSKLEYLSRLAEGKRRCESCICPILRSRDSEDTVESSFRSAHCGLSNFLRAFFPALVVVGRPIGYKDSFTADPLAVMLSRDRVFWDHGLLIILGRTFRNESVGPLAEVFAHYCPVEFSVSRV